MEKVIKSLFISAALAAAAIAGESENFGGIGISVWPGKGGVKVAGVMPNSPAESIGLQSGDLIVSANGIELSSVEPEKQIGFIRGEAGSSINLVIDRSGNVFSVSAKRMGISVQNLDAKDISDWYGKTQGLTGEEINHLASQKVTEGYQLLGVMQYGALVSSSAENLNAGAIQQISIKRVEEVKLPQQKPIQNNVLDMSLSNKAENSPLVNVKGARIAKKQGNAPLYRTIR